MENAVGHAVCGRWAPSPCCSEAVHGLLLRGNAEDTDCVLGDSTRRHDLPGAAFPTALAARGASEACVGPARARPRMRRRSFAPERPVPDGRDPFVARLSRNLLGGAAVRSSRRASDRGSAGSGSDRGELVAVELGEVVGCHQQPPFGPDRDPASSVESADQPVVFGVREHGLDHLDSLAVELFAVL